MGHASFITELQTCGFQSRRVQCVSRQFVRPLNLEYCLSMILIALLAAPLSLTSIEFCSSRPEPPATEPPEWHSTTVDGRKCYFRADKLLPQRDLLWSFDAKQFDIDEGAKVK